MTVAGRLGWRDVVTQIWLFRDRLLADDLDGALDHADAVMRRQDVVPKALLLALAQAARDPRSTDALVGHLTPNPVVAAAVLGLPSGLRPAAGDRCRPIAAAAPGEGADAADQR